MDTTAELEKRKAFLADPSREPQTRSFLIKREAINVDARTVELAFSSEAPVERWWGIEILDHSPASVDLNRLRNAGAVLMDHDPREQVGVVENCQIEGDRVGRAVVRFGRSDDAEEVFQDIVDGIRQHVSVGYRIHKVEVSEPDSAQPTYRATLWEPYEISIVSIPADTSVGVGRSESLNPPPAPVAPPAPHVSVTRNAPMTEPVIDQAAIEKRGEAAAMQRVNEILATGQAYEKHGGMEVAREAITAGHDLRWVNEQIMKRMAAGQGFSPSAPDVGMSGKEIKRYSVARAINAMVTGDWKDAGLEREAHETLLKRGVVAARGGVLVPYEVQKRDMSTAANGGGYLVETVNGAASFIELLRNRTVVGELGATTLSGLKGNITIPKQTAAGTAYWLSNETTSATESNQTIGQLAMSPKTVGAYTEYSRQLMLQSAPAIDMLIMNDLARVLAIAVDLAALEGNGSSAPVGIANTSGIGSVTGTSLAYEDILEFQTDVAAANALAANCAYVTTPAVASLLAQRQKFSNTDTPLWEGGLIDGRVSGFRGVATNQVTAASMIFGDFAQVIIGEWGTLELAVNPVAGFAAGIVGIRAFQTVDVGIRYAGAFSRATSIT